MPAVKLSHQEGIRAVRQALTSVERPPRWPMYARQARQFLRAAIEGFDERAYGFASVTDLLRAAGKEGVLRVERDRQGAVRVFQGPNLVLPSAPDGETAEAASPSEPVEAGDAQAADAPAAKKKATRARKSTTARKAKATKKTASKTAKSSGTRKRAAKKTKAAAAEPAE